MQSVFDSIGKYFGDTFQSNEIEISLLHWIRYNCYSPWHVCPYSPSMNHLDNLLKRMCGSQSQLPSSASQLLLSFHVAKAFVIHHHIISFIWPFQPLRWVMWLAHVQFIWIQCLWVSFTQQIIRKNWPNISHRLWEPLDWQQSLWLVWWCMHCKPNGNSHSSEP